MPPPFSALHIGVNQVAPDRYVDPPRALRGAENDARALALRSSAAGLTPMTLTGLAATRAHVLAQLEVAAAAHPPGALFVLSFSGHGAQDVDRLSMHPGDELDGLDEVWCLADDFLLDDELYATLARFAPGVRILILADSCHSGDSFEALGHDPGDTGSLCARDYPREAARRSLGARAEELQARAAAAATRPPVRASVILLAACASEGLAFEDGDHGVFTTAFCKLWDSDTRLGHRAFVEALSVACPAQTPVYQFIAPEDEAFADQRPLTAAPPLTSQTEA